MSSKKRNRWYLFAVLIALLLFAAFLWIRPLLNIGSGYAAKHACSCHFLQGRELEEIREHDLNFSVLGWASLSLEENSVHSSFFGLVGRQAVYREGIGCTLINDERKTLANTGAAAGATPVPRAEDAVDYLPSLEEALDIGMAPVEGGGARGIVVMQNGRIIGERYAEGYDKNSLLLGWSMTKSLTGLAWGYRRLLKDEQTDDELIDDLLNRDRLYPAWTNDARANIELQDLLHMNSGLGWDEAYGSITDATIMLHEQPDMSAYAAGMPAIEPPNEQWVYSSGTTNILVDLLAKDLEASGTNIYDHFHELFEDIAPSLLIEPDQGGQPVGSSYGWATARDWANLGQFMLQDGVWNGDTLLQPGWVDFMREPAVGSDGIYGGQLWLPGPEMPSLPSDAFMMRGFQDQRVFVVPSLQLVVVRLGHNTDKRVDFDAFVAFILSVI